MLAGRLEGEQTREAVAGLIGGVELDPTSPELWIDLIRELFVPQPVEEELTLLRRSLRLARRGRSREMIHRQRMRDELRILRAKIRDALIQVEEAEAELAEFDLKSPPPRPRGWLQRLIWHLSPPPEVRRWASARHHFEMKLEQARHRLAELRHEREELEGRLSRDSDEGEEPAGAERLELRVKAKLVQLLAERWKWGEFDRSEELFELVREVLRGDGEVGLLRVVDGVLSGDVERLQSAFEELSATHPGELAELALGLVKLIRKGRAEFDRQTQQGLSDLAPRLRVLAEMVQAVQGLPTLAGPPLDERSRGLVALASLAAGATLGRGAQRRVEELAGEGVALARELLGLRELARGNLSRAGELLRVEEAVGRLAGEDGFKPGEERWLCLVVAHLYLSGERGDPLTRTWQALYRLPKSSLFYLLTHTAHRDPEALERYRRLWRPFYRWSPGGGD